MFSTDLMWRKDYKHVFIFYVLLSAQNTELDVWSKAVSIAATAAPAGSAFHRLWKEPDDKDRNTSCNIHLSGGEGGGGRNGAAPPSAPLRIFTPGALLLARKSEEMFTERKHRTKLGVLLMYPRDMCIY